MESPDSSVLGVHLRPDRLVGPGSGSLLSVPGAAAETGRLTRGSRLRTEYLDHPGWAWLGRSRQVVGWVVQPGHPLDGPGIRVLSFFSSTTTLVLYTMVQEGPWSNSPALT